MLRPIARSSNSLDRHALDAGWNEIAGDDFLSSRGDLARAE
jgi:hypothetical protein